jgi:pimeloyl-ACP methyl ester carboxylesterase
MAAAGPLGRIRSTDRSDPEDTLVRQLRITTSIALGGLALLVGACSGNSPAAPPTAAAAAPTTAPFVTRPPSHDLVTDVAVDGHKLHVACVGPIDSGRPTVLFEAGLGGDLGTWSNVLTQLQATDRACSYERLGVGRSDMAPAPRTTTDQVAELRAVLDQLDISPPYVLVGYSVGGWNVMVHNDLHGGDVVGAVLADVRPPGASARWLELLPAETPGEPEGIRLTREEVTIFEAEPMANPELLDLRKSAAEALATGGFGSKPLVVLAAANTTVVTEGLPGPLAADFEAAWWELEQSMADQSTIGRLEKVENASHDMPWERTDAIVAAILEVLGE